MPVSALPIVAVSPGNVLTSTNWNAIVKDNLNKLLNSGHRVLTVAQFAALGAPEGTKGTVAPDEVYLEVDSTNGVQWHLAYESGEVTYKWRFLGGPPMVSEVVTPETTASTTYVALTTAGPSIAVPRSGDYDVETVARFAGSVAAAGADSGYMSYDIGGTGAVDADAVNGFTSISTLVVTPNTGARTRRKAGLTAITLTCKYRSDSASVTGSFANRTLRIWPVRLI